MHFSIIFLAFRGPHVPPQNYVVYLINWIGLTLHYQRQDLEAQRWFDTALQLQPNAENVLYNKAVSLAKLGV